MDVTTFTSPIITGPVTLSGQSLSSLSLPVAE